MTDEAISKQPSEATLGLETYKMAYQVAATRYDNIYKSAWTIFSYMTAVSAGILSFGGGKFYGEPLTALACLPLVFWFLTTYLPLDMYGNGALKDLQRLEGIFSDQFHLAVNHFRSFHEQRQNSIWRRARTWIYIFMTCLHLVFFYSLAISVHKLYVGDSLMKAPSRSVTVQVP